MPACLCQPALGAERRWSWWRPSSAWQANRAQVRRAAIPSAAPSCSSRALPVTRSRRVSTAPAPVLPACSAAGRDGRKGFTRYSPALAAAEVVWTEQSLDVWLADPQGVIPSNRMTFPDIADRQARADLIAYRRGRGRA
jgi:hypothetical protein